MKRSLKLVLAGLLCAGLGSLGLWLAWTAVHDGQDVLVAAQPIPAGHSLTADDATTVRVVVGAGVEVWPSDEAVIGRVALVDIPAGALLTPSALGDSSPDGSLARLAVIVDIGRAPVESLVVGAPVTLLGATGEPVSGTVVSSPELLPDAAHHRFDVQVEWADAPRLAQWVALGQVVVAAP